MNQKGSALLIIIAIIVVLVVGGTITYFLFFGGSSECIKICKDDGFNSGKEKTNQCSQGETAVEKCCCSNVIGGGSGGTNGGQTPGTPPSIGTLPSTGWCTPGSDTGARDIVSAHSGSKGSSLKVIKDEVQGIETFRGKSACHVVFDLEVTSPKGQKIISNSDVYIYKYKDDTWNINTTMGVATFEYHWVNGNSICIEGNGCDLINSLPSK
ncbi:MAG: hypothetical protein HY979_00250 [Candidatus Magasanikbacteria bacterium]|nr:hypothetical protein [Candidatus Magasanikbacteria bacterium]